MKLEAGKRYWRRDGGVSGPLVKSDIEHPAFRFGDGLSRWYEDGVYLWGRQESEFDLIAEYTDPQPLEWKRGIPTEDECRECWIVPGGRLPVPVAMGCLYRPQSIEKTHYLMCENGGWYLAVRIKPVEPPKPKTVTLCKLVHKNGAELWWPHGVTFATFDDLTETGEKKEVEVPA